MPQEPKLKAQSTIWKKIRRLNLPQETKKKLRELWHEAKALIQAIVEWLYKRKEFCASVMLGVAVAYLVHPLPVLGPILATLSVSLSPARAPTVYSPSCGANAFREFAERRLTPAIRQLPPHVASTSSV